MTFTAIRFFSLPRSHIRLRTSPYREPRRLFQTYSVPLSTRRPLVLGAAIGLLTGWAVDKYVYAEALGRTVRLAYNAALVILDYKINFAPELNSDDLHARVSARMARTCTTNGGLYIKLGQSLAIQAAVLPAPYKAAFETMFDASEPIPFSEVRKVWEEEFSDRIENVFEEFAATPVACGSIAQVHKAQLKETGEVVAVKIQRPAIPIQIELDLFAYKSLLYVCEKAFGLPIYFIAQYVSDQIRHETDFVREATNSERTAKLFESDALLRNEILIPKVNWRWTTKRVLTTEFVEGGCRLTEEAKLKENGLKNKDVMNLAMEMFSSMLFKFGWLHCDLHPGNVLVVKKNGKPKLALIDHGLYINLPDKFRAEYCELWRSIFVLDTAAIQRIASGWGIANSELFASATLLRPFKIHKNPESLTRGQQVLIERWMRLVPEDLKVKETLKGMLENEQLIPRELIFIVRCMRMMQGNNQVLGSPSNRINILAHGAASGMTTSKLMSYGDGPVANVLRNWLTHLAHVWTFRLALIFVDLGFFITQIRQWWLKDVRGNKRGEGFEDLLQRQIESMAKEEFGITLDDTSFMG